MLHAHAPKAQVLGIQLHQGSLPDTTAEDAVASLCLGLVPSETALGLL